MLKEQKGITLIALVITIIVLLILAGVTIAMLTGENGILNRATSTRAINADAQAEEQAKLAYMAVRTEIAAKMTQNGTYSAIQNVDTPDPKITGDISLKALVEKELVASEGWTVSSSKTPTTGAATSATITIKYDNTSLEKIKVYTITLTKTSPYATFEEEADEARP